ncbi:MAG TPA: alpha/beta hydrolase [Streptosporangiaceae bacterium]
MAPIDRRVRLWAWVVRHQASVASRSEAEVIALQSRHTPSNAVTNRLFGSVAPGTLVTDRRIPGPGGDLPVRVYEPAGAACDARPLIVYFHGGGFVFGDLRLGDWLCSQVAVTVGAVVVSVEYRLAPVHRFPAAVDDCYAGLAWAAENAASLHAGGPLGVMGESAGGTLSAVICLLARDRGGPAISHQALLYPATDLTDASASAAAADERTPFLTPAEMAAYRLHYLAGADPRDSRVSPLLADDHRRLPPALIQIAEHDPLHDDGARYAAALRHAGVPVRLTEYVGMPHGYLNFPGLCRSAPQALAELCSEQAAALAPPVAAASGGPG